MFFFIDDGRSVYILRPRNNVSSTLYYAMHNPDKNDKIENGVITCICTSIKLYKII